MDHSWSYLHYNQFSVGSASEKYKLTVGGFTGRTNWFALHPLNGMKFTSLDNDNDDSNRNCTAISNNGWWFNHCQLMMLTVNHLLYTVIYFSLN